MLLVSQGFEISKLVSGHHVRVRCEISSSSRPQLSGQPWVPSVTLIHGSPLMPDVRVYMLKTGELLKSLWGKEA